MAPRPRISALLLAAALATPAAAVDLEQSISIKARDTPLPTLLSAICERAGLNLVLGVGIPTQKVTVSLKSLPLSSALKYIGALHKVGIALTADGKTVLAASPETIDGLDLGKARVVPLAHADADQFAALLNKVYKGRVEAIPDPRTNTVIVVPRGR